MPQTRAADAVTDPYALMVGFYDRWSARMGDVPFYVARALEAAPGPIVELGAGTGRVAIEVARAGVAVIGVEPSAAMRAEGERRAREADVAARARFVDGDMRTFVATEPVGLVTIPFRSFLHNLTTDDQLATLASVRASLRPGGRLIMNVFTVDPAVVVARDGKRAHQFSWDDAAGHHEAYATPSHELATQRLDVLVEYEVWDAGRLVSRAEDTLRLRTVSRYEMEHLFARSGLDVEALHGDFDGKPYGPGPDEMIWIVRRP